MTNFVKLKKAYELAKNKNAYLSIQLRLYLDGSEDFSFYISWAEDDKQVDYATQDIDELIAKLEELSKESTRMNFENKETFIYWVEYQLEKSTKSRDFYYKRLMEKNPESYQMLLDNFHFYKGERNAFQGVLDMFKNNEKAPQPED